MIGLRKSWMVLPIMAAALTGCGGVSNGDVEAALESAWAEDTALMAKVAGINLPGEEPGALRGAAKSAKMATELANRYGGSIAGDTAASVINGASELAEDFGIDGANSVRAAIGVATASDWQVRNLEILAERESGDDVVANLRYDLSVTIQDEPVTIGRDIMHEVRLISTGAGWRVEKQQ